MIDLTEGAYWKAKCLIAEATAEAVRAELVALQGQWALARAQERAQHALRAAGLDPSRNYRWHDASHTVEPAEPES